MLCQGRTRGEDNDCIARWSDWCWAMGNGIAHVMALAGYNVVLNDIDQMALDKSVEIIEKNMMRQLRGGKITEEALQTALSRITGRPRLRRRAIVILSSKPRLKMNRSSKRYLMPCCPI